MAASSAGSVKHCSRGSESCFKHIRTAAAWSGTGVSISSLTEPAFTVHGDLSAPIRSTPPRASSRSSAMSNRRYLKLVLPRLATRIFMSADCGVRNAELEIRNGEHGSIPHFALRIPRSLFQDRFQHCLFRPRDHVRADQVAVLGGGLGASVHGGAD